MSILTKKQLIRNASYFLPDIMSSYEELPFIWLKARYRAIREELNRRERDR